MAALDAAVECAAYGGQGEHGAVVPHDTTTHRHTVSTGTHRHIERAMIDTHTHIGGGETH